MFTTIGRLKLPALFVLLCLTASFCWADENLDRSKYIGVDEIRPGMKAYSLTVYKGTEVEKFDMEVLDVIRNFMPGRDAILVKGIDERFIHTGPVAGCSGSPVYIDDRLAGALSFGWTFSKDPLYGVTPIKDMLRVGKTDNLQQKPKIRFSFDFSQPLDFFEIEKQIKGITISRNMSGGRAALPCPLVISGLSADVCQKLGAQAESLGFHAVSGLGLSESNPLQKTSEADELSPGAVLAVPLVTGDIRMTVMGTVTEVVGKEVYGFGHGFLGYGDISLPMACGKIHTVVSSLVRSWKLGSPLEIVGAVKVDESTAIKGQIGARARMTPLTIKVARYNDQSRVYNCQIVNNRVLMPVVFGLAVGGASSMLGDFPPDNLVEYKINVELKDAGSIVFQNVSTGTGVSDMLREAVGSVALLMNNPYKEVTIESISCEVNVIAKNILSHIWSAELSDTKLKPGQSTIVSVVIESVRSGKKKYQYRLNIPKNLKPGKYNVIIAGWANYIDFLNKAVPHRFTAQNFTNLVEIINNILNIQRDKLYCLFVLPSDGVVLQKAELPYLPATKVLVLADAKRAMQTIPYKNWQQKSFDTETIVIGRETLQIIVEKEQ